MHSMRAWQLRRIQGFGEMREGQHVGGECSPDLRQSVPGAQRCPYSACGSAVRQSDPAGPIAPPLSLFGGQRGGRSTPSLWRAPQEGSTRLAGMMPWRLMRPNEGLRPTTPQWLAGPRTESPGMFDEGPQHMSRIRTGVWWEAPRCLISVSITAASTVPACNPSVPWCVPSHTSG